MTDIGHAEAHERLMDLVLEPDGLRQLAMVLSTPSNSADGDPLTEHVVSCPTCRDVVRGWDRMHASVRHAIGPAATGAQTTLQDLAGDEPERAPIVVRSSLMAFVHATLEAAAAPTPVARTGDGASDHRFMSPAQVLRHLRRRLAPIAVMIAITSAGIFVINQSSTLEQVRRDNASLQEVAAVVDRVLRDPDHRVVDLRTPGGTLAGSFSWSSRDFVVLTEGLPAPPTGRVYACWIQRAGVRLPIGRMSFVGGTAFWAGSLDRWATTAFGSGTFGISLESATGPGGGPDVLVGDLGP